MSNTKNIGIENLCEFYYNTLVKDCIPFWMKNALDHDFGGYLTCLDREKAKYTTQISQFGSKVGDYGRFQSCIMM